MDIITSKSSGPNRDFIRRRTELFDEEKMAKFSACSSDRDRFSIVHATLQEARKEKRVPIDSIVGPDGDKSLERALEFKQKGNQYFKDAQWMDAMKCYTLSYLETPQEKSEELSIILANRSAALFHLGRYELSLRDINRSLAAGYPADMEYKLRERQARCHMANKNPYEAMEAFKLTIKALDKSKLPMERRLKMEKECETMIQLFIRNKEKPRAPAPASTAARKPKFQLHEAVTFDHDEKNGRYAKAKERIQVGATVVVEKPHCSMLLEKYKMSHCHHCYKRTMAPLGCGQCQEVVFCGEKCRDAATYHQNECRILKNLNASGLSIICYLAMRILSQKNVQYFETFFKEIGDNEEKEIPMEDRLE